VREFVDTREPSHPIDVAAGDWGAYEGSRWRVVGVQREDGLKQGMAGYQTSDSSLVIVTYEVVAGSGVTGDALDRCSGRLSDARGRLKDQFSAFVDYAMDRPSRYQLLFALIPIDTVEADMMRGHLRPAYRQVLHMIEGFVAEGGRLPGEDVPSSTLLLISLAHGRIALAHLAPHRAGNSAAGVQAFVLDAIDRLFVLAG
jgi:hypothetical protein